MASKPCAAALLGSVALAAACSAAAQTPGPASNPLDVLPMVPALPAGHVEVEIPAAPAGAPGDRIVRPTRFAIEGVRSIAFKDVAALFAPLVGQRTSVAGMVQRAQQATALYRDAGYALSFLFVPAQDFAGGVVRVVAVEGHVIRVQVEGDTGHSAARIEAIAAPVLAERPLTQATFERVTGLLGQLPGLAIAAQVPAPAATDGATILVLKVTRKAAGVVIGSELGSPRSRAVLSAELNDFLAGGNQLSASTLVLPRNGERYHALAYQQALGADGLVLRASASLFEAPTSPVPLPDATLHHDVSSRRAELALSAPLLLGATRSLVLSGGVYATDGMDGLRNPATGAWVADDTRVRTAYVQLAHASATADASQSASVLLAQGIGALGARSDYVGSAAAAGSPGVDLRFTRVLLQATDTRRWPFQLGTAVRATAQFATDRLPASERITFGGSRYARAYAPGETSGDGGLGLGLELNRRFATGVPLAIEPFVALEWARVDRPPAGSPSQLASLSLGLRLADQRIYTVEFAYGKPVGDAPLENPGRKPRASLAVSYRLGD